MLKVNDLSVRTRRGICVLLATIAVGQWAFIAHKVFAENATLIAHKRHAIEGKWVEELATVKGDVKTCKYSRPNDGCQGMFVSDPIINRGKNGDPITVIPRQIEVDDLANDCYQQPLSIQGHYGGGESNIGVSEICPVTPTVLYGSINTRHNTTVAHAH